MHGKVANLAKVPMGRVVDPNELAGYLF